MKKDSLRYLLLSSLLFPLVALLVIGVIGDYFTALQPAVAAYDENLLSTALALANNAKFAHGEITLDLPPAADQVLRTDKYDRIYYSVRGPRQELLAGNKELRLPALAMIPNEAVYYDGDIQGEPVRVAALRVSKGGSDLFVQVAETKIKRKRLISKILITMVLPEVFFSAAAIALVWFGIKRGLAPLERLRAEISSRAHNDLRPVAMDNAPLEVKPLVQDINSLIWRISNLLNTQKRFFSNAAHQLRTPLAGLQVQVELAIAQAGSTEWKHTFKQIQMATMRITHLVNQLLVLARAEPGDHPPESLKPTDLRDIASTAAMEFKTQAFAKDIDLGFELEPACVLGEPSLLYELLSNLIDNAIRYTPPNGYVTVRCGARGNEAFLTVNDNGPGIPSAERENVFERFRRLDGTPGEGCGLGLAIVKEIAHRHGASVSLTTPSTGDGTEVSVHFERLATETNRDGLRSSRGEAAEFDATRETKRRFEQD
ncbi:MAG TPA: sensor histidine kinase N-terminal domain-containing protein [Burkholderiales bacterium]|nr:sensor histidine kinase N-terminal domain-containing protein [Burkholderiales bacterium]